MTVSLDGVKLSGVQNAINAEALRATTADQSISGSVYELSAETMSFSAATVNEIARLDGKDIEDGPYELSIDGLVLNRENSERIEISFNGNFGTDMPSPID